MIDGTKLAFLEGVLGQGATALQKAVAKAPVLENLLLPRTIISWLNIATQIGYDGAIPGIPDSQIHLQKSEEDNWSGSIEIAGHEYEFVDADICRVGAHIAVAVGADDDKINPQAKTVDIVKLGKTIDLLVKSRAVKVALEKGWPKDATENRENQEAHAVLQDMAAEQGKQVKPKKVKAPIPSSEDNWDSSWENTDDVLADAQVDAETALPPKKRASLYKEWRPGNFLPSWATSHSQVVKGQSRASDKGVYHLHHGVDNHGRQGWHTDFYPSSFPYGLGIFGSEDEARAAVEHHITHLQNGGKHQDWKRPAYTPKPPPTEYERKFGSSTEKAENTGRASHERAGTPETLKPDAPAPQQGPTKQVGVPKTYMPKMTGHNPSGPVAKTEIATKITKAQANAKCSTCGASHSNGGSFTGCNCLADLAKSITATPDNKGGYILSFSLPTEQIVTVLTVLKGQ